MTHPIYIDDVSLEGFRDRLIWLLEITWPEVGLVLLTAKKVEDLCYPSIWGEQRESLPVVGALLRFPKHPCRTDANNLHKMRNDISVIDQSIKDSYDDERKCKENLEKVDAALTQELNAEQQILLTEKRKERLQALIDATAQRVLWDSRRREADAALKNCETHFARTEIMKFCKNRRYIKNPLNAANALAGLPFIGWRRSAERCQKLKIQATGRATDLVRVINRIVESWNPSVALYEYAGRWLQLGNRYKPTVQSELRKDFFYLRRAIDEVLKGNHRRKALPYLITSEYQRRVSNRSPVDILFEDEERILLKSEKNRVSRKPKSNTPEEHRQ
jgi:hypothetical protein